MVGKEFGMDMPFAQDWGRTSGSDQAPDTDNRREELGRDRDPHGAVRVYYPGDDGYHPQSPAPWSGKSEYYVTEPPVYGIFNVVEPVDDPSTPQT